MLWLVGVSAALAAMAVASWVVADGVVVAYVSLPFGLYVFAGVALLLSGDGIFKFYGRRARRSSPATATASCVVQPWSDMSLEQCCEALVLPPHHCDRGWSAPEAAAALARHGPNVLPMEVGPSLWRALLKELHEPQQKLLLIVAVLYALVGQVDEAALAIGVIVLMAIAEVVTEVRAKRALAAMQTSAPQFTHVLRDGHGVNVRVDDVVPGDVLVLQTGFNVPADGRLLTTRYLAVDEAQLTGESALVVKDASAHDAADACSAPNMVFAGSVVQRGGGRALVVATGASTQLGVALAAAKSARTKEKRTPLQRLLQSMAARLTVVALVGSALGGLLGFTRSMPWQDVVLIVLSLAFATIPEELPILVAAVLAVGAQTLGATGVYVKRLRAMEALAYVDVVLTDKTGTLTRNVLTCSGVVNTAVDAAASTGAGAGAGDGDGDGDGGPRAFVPIQAFVTHQPSAASAIVAAWLATADRDYADAFDTAVAASFPEQHAAACAAYSTAPVLYDQPFESATKVATRVVVIDGCATVFVKGAPEAVLARCQPSAVASTQHSPLSESATPLSSLPTADALLAAVTDAAALGYRMVALARAVVPPSLSNAPWPSVVDRLHTAQLVGILCFSDPVRAEVPAAVATCQAAGVRVVMVTGDHGTAATCIARQVGLLVNPRRSDVIVCGTVGPGAARRSVANGDVTVTGVDDAGTNATVALDAWCDNVDVMATAAVARATPLHKLKLVQRYQAAGHVVAVTGDGVNDAAALSAADVGIAVQGATDVARQACSMVVVGGDFTSLVHALVEGRRLFDNLVHALAFYLGAKLGLLVIFVAGTLWRGFPLAPVQVRAIRVRFPCEGRRGRCYGCPSVWIRTL